jgi:hypothetical protein
MKGGIGGKRSIIIWGHTHYCFKESAKIRPISMANLFADLIYFGLDCFNCFFALSILIFVRC